MHNLSLRQNLVLDTLAFQRSDGLQFLVFFGGDVD